MEKDSTEIIVEGFKEIIKEIEENNGRGMTTDVHDLLTRLSVRIKNRTGITYDVRCLAKLFAQERFWHDKEVRA